MGIFSDSFYRLFCIGFHRFGSLISDTNFYSVKNGSSVVCGKGS